MSAKRFLVMLMAVLAVSGCGTAQTPGSPGAQAAAATLSSTPSGRYPGGIPKTIGNEPVLMGFGAFVHGAHATDATPFLAGGWFGDGTRNACTHGAIPAGTPDPNDFMPDVFTHGCGSVIGADSPWGANSWPGPLGLIAWNGHTLPTGIGPAVIRVHTHDPRSEGCGAGTKSSCQQTFIVDDVMWTGDAASKASPISVGDVAVRVDALIVQDDLPIEGGTVAVQRRVVLTPRQDACGAGSAVATFDLQGDPRLGLVAVFPTEAARTAAQPAFTTDASCRTDTRIVRPGAAKWVGVQNVLVLVFGDDMLTAVEAALTSPAAGAPGTAVGFPPSSLDESYAFLSYYLAARAAGNVATAGHFQSGDPNEFSVDEVERRYEADALTYVIGPAVVPAESQLPAAVRTSLASQAVAGTVRMYEVTHQNSTDPALRTETFIAYELKNPQIDSWTVQRLTP